MVRSKLYCCWINKNQWQICGDSGPGNTVQEMVGEKSQVAWSPIFGWWGQEQCEPSDHSSTQSEAPAQRKWIWAPWNGAWIELLSAQIKWETRAFGIGHVELNDNIVFFKKRQEGRSIYLRKIGSIYIYIDLGISDLDVMWSIGCGTRGDRK